MPSASVITAKEVHFISLRYMRVSECIFRLRTILAVDIYQQPKAEWQK